MRVLKAIPAESAPARAGLRAALPHSVQPVRRPGAAPGVGDQARRFAHDFRNLLLVAETRVELAQMEAAGNAGAAASLSAARQALAQARELVRLLDEAPAESGPRVRPLNLAAVVAASAEELRPLLPASIELEVDADRSLDAMVDGDGTQIGRIVRNLALNARDAMPAGGRLRIAVESLPAGGSARQVTLVVTDTGTGMDAATCSRIFEPFFTTKAAHGGTGLGLAIVREIADAHRAQVDVESAPGSGTTVRVTFACRRPRLSTRAAAPASDVVLVVGQDARLRGLADRTLGICRPEFHFAGGTREALQVLERRRGAVRCLVVDAASVPADEVATLRALRSWRGRRGFVLVMPAGVARARRRCDRGECVLVRPLVMGELERSVRRALESVN